MTALPRPDDASVAAGSGAQGERRVALTPETCGKLVKAGCAVSIQRGLGDRARFPDDAVVQGWFAEMA